MNLELAEAAEVAVRKGRFELRPGYCLRFCREVDEAVEGTLYERLFRGDGTAGDATAARAGHRFLARGLGFLRSELDVHGGIRPGDMLVKTQVARNRWGDFSGHIGIVCADGKRVAENSSTSQGRVRGALGFRTLVQYGAFDIVVRLPESATRTQVAEKTTAVFSFNQKPMPYAFFERGRVMVPLVDFLHASGYETYARDVTAQGGNIQAWKASK